MNEPKFKIADTLTIHGEATIAQVETVTSHRYLQSNAVDAKLDTLLSELNERQTREMESLATEVLKFFTSNFDKLNPRQQEKVEAVKTAGWKGKIKLALPFVEVEAEKEFEAGAVMSNIRDALYGDKLVTLDLLNAEKR